MPSSNETQNTPVPDSADPITNKTVKTRRSRAHALAVTKDLHKIGARTLFQIDLIGTKSGLSQH